ncbi:hypothetical protein ABZW30_08210 [Kitasatospora sp. NPDC004669]|uniref:hypothetical protein n=1 Tax=Kitasatospora sp. NPDC004669 TaxID=3154555 RepID=UPI0033A0BCB9
MNTPDHGAAAVLRSLARQLDAERAKVPVVGHLYLAPDTTVVATQIADLAAITVSFGAELVVLANEPSDQSRQASSELACAATSIGEAIAALGRVEVQLLFLEENPPHKAAPEANAVIKTQLHEARAQLGHAAEQLGRRAQSLTAPRVSAARSRTSTPLAEGQPSTNPPATGSERTTPSPRRH